MVPIVILVGAVIVGFMILAAVISSGQSRTRRGTAANSDGSAAMFSGGDGGCDSGSDGGGCDGGGGDGGGGGD